MRAIDLAVQHTHFCRKMCNVVNTRFLMNFCGRYLVSFCGRYLSKPQWPPCIWAMVAHGSMGGGSSSTDGEGPHFTQKWVPIFTK